MAGAVKCTVFPALTVCVCWQCMQVFLAHWNLTPVAVKVLLTTGERHIYGTAAAPCLAVCPPEGPPGVLPHSALWAPRSLLQLASMLGRLCARLPVWLCEWRCRGGRCAGWLCGAERLPGSGSAPAAKGEALSTAAAQQESPLAGCRSSCLRCPACLLQPAPA